MIAKASSVTCHQANKALDDRFRALPAATAPPSPFGPGSNRRSAADDWSSRASSSRKRVARVIAQSILESHGTRLSFHFPGPLSLRACGSDISRHVHPDRLQTIRHPSINLLSNT